MTGSEEHRQRRRLLSDVFSKSIYNSPHLKNVTHQILHKQMLLTKLTPGTTEHSVVRDLRNLHGSFTMDFLTAFSFTPTHSTRFLSNPDDLPRFQLWVAKSRATSLEVAAEGKNQLESWCLSMCRAYYAEFQEGSVGLIKDCPAGVLFGAGLGEDDVAAELLDHLSKSRVNVASFGMHKNHDLYAHIFLVTADKNLAIVHTYAVYTMSLYSDIQDRLRKELSQLSLQTLSIDDLDKLPFFDAVVLELMRTHTEVKSLTPRIIPQTVFSICLKSKNNTPCILPPGTVISSTREHLHQDPAVFPQPLSFWPERWLGTSEAHPQPCPVDSIKMGEMRNRLWYFGSGIHSCVARQYALYGSYRIVHIKRLVTSFLS
jgi:hypothetical protein